MLLGACVLATGAMAALLAQRDATAALRLQSGAHLTEVARSLAAALDRELFQRWRDIQAIAALDPLRDPPAPAAARRAWLGRLPETFPAFAEFGLVAPEGGLVASSGGLPEGLDLSQQDYVLAGRLGPYAGEAHAVAQIAEVADPGPDLPTRFVAFAAPVREAFTAPVREADAARAGVVVAWMSLDRMAELKRGILDGMRLRMPGVHGFILDRHATVLLGPNGWPVQGPAPPSGLGDAAEAGTEADPVVGRARTQGYRDFPGLGWSVVVRQDAAAVLAPARALRDRILVLGLVAGTLTALLGWWAAGRLGRARAAGPAPAAASAPPALPGAAAPAGTPDRSGSDLAMREAELRGLLRACPIGMVFSDTGGRVRQANDAFLGLLGLSRLALARGEVRWDELTPPEWLPRDEAAIAEAVAHGRCAPYEKEFLHADGTRVPVLVAFALVDRATGQAAGYVVDLTERRRAEVRLAGVNEQLRLAIGAARMFFWDWDLRSGRVEWSDGLEAACGLPPGGFGGNVDRFRALVDPADLPRVEAALGRALAGEDAAYEAEFRMRRADGSRRWVLARGTVLRDAAGQPLRVVGIDLDITDRKALESALTESEGLLRRGAEAGGLAIFEVEAPGTGAGGEARVSDAFRSLWGLPPEARCDFPTLLARVHPDDRAAFAAGHRRLAEAGGGFDATFRVVLPDGGLRWIRARGEASAGGDGAPAQIRGISFDVTDRYTQEQTRRDLLQLAEGSPDLIGLATLEGRLTYLNPAGRRMLGVAPGTAAGSLVLADHLAPASQALLRTVAIPRLLEAGVWEGDMRLVQAGTGAVIEARHLASALRDPAGRPVGLACVIRDVTADRQALAARAEGEARWRGLLENLHEGVVLCELVEDAAGRAVDIRYLEINGDGWERMTGIPAAAALGRRMTEVIPDIEPAWIEAYDAVVRDGTALHFEMPVAALGRRFEVHAFPLGGRRFGVSFLEISERWQAQCALAESEARFRGLADALPAFVFVTDAGGGSNIFTNTVFQDYVGLPAEALAGHAWTAVVHPDDIRRVAAAWQHSIATGAPHAIEVRIRRRDGAWRWFLVRCVAERDAAGQILRWIGTCTDVHDWRAAEIARTEAEDQLRLAVEAAELGGWSWNLRTGVLDATPRCRSLYGLPPAMPLDWDALTAAIFPADLPRWEAAIADALAARSDYAVEYRVGLPGALAWRRNVGRVEIGPDGAAVALRGVVFDIDQQKRAEAALREDRDRLEERIAERTRALAQAAAELTAEMQRRESIQNSLLQSQKLEALGQLTGGVAHDFNNILAAIQGGYRLLERRIGDNPAARDLVRHGLDASERGRRLIAQLMAFARKEELRPRRVDPGMLLREAEELICQTAGSRVRCSFEVEAEPWPVITDPVRLETVLLNLAANARDAMPSGGRLTFGVRQVAVADLPAGLAANRGHVLIAVTDTGIGMDAETLRRAAEPFFTTKPPGKGTGLGLASAHGFAAQSGGALRLRSAPGEGTTVELFLPRADILSGEVPDRAHDPGEAVADPSLHGNATLLVVDDDDGVRPVTGGFLRELGYRVIEAASAEAAEVLAHTGDAVDMLVTDIVMPGAHGHILATRLRAERPALPVLFITGYGHGALLGDTPVLSKPFTEAALARAILAGLGRTPRRAAAAGNGPAGDRLIGRLRRPALRQTYLRWLALRGGGALPPPSAMAGADLPAEVPDNAYLLDVLEDGRFRFRTAGRALEERLGRPLAGAIVGTGQPADDALASVFGEADGAAYQRCVTGRGAYYDYARFALDSGQPVLFERLLLPLAADGGEQVTQVFGVALFTELAAAPGDQP